MLKDILIYIKYMKVAEEIREILHFDCSIVRVETWVMERRNSGMIQALICK